MIPVVVNARPFGQYSMVDIDAKGGMQVVVKELLEAVNGNTLTCTGETLQQQIVRLDPPARLRSYIPIKNPFKKYGWTEVLGGNLSPDFSAVLKLAGVDSVLKIIFLPESKSV